MGAFPDTLKKILDHKYRAEKFEGINIPYLEDFIKSSQPSYQYASSIRSSLIVDQNLYLSSLTKFNDYQELIHSIDTYLNQLSILNLGVTNIYASSIQGLIEQSQIVEFTTDAYASDILGTIMLSQIEDLNLDVYASDIIGLINSSQINYIYQSQVQGLSSTVYSSNLVGKIVKSQISSITANIIEPYILSSQIESMDFEILPIASSVQFGYCLDVSPCLTTSGDYQPLVGSLDLIGALEALTYCNMWAYGYAGMTSTNMLNTHTYHYHISSTSESFTATPPQLQSCCFAYLMGASLVMPYDD